MTCKRIAKLLSEQQDHGLSFPRRLAIRVHLALCVFCRRLARQLEIIRGLSQMIGGAGDVSMIDDGLVFDAALSSDAKSRMKKMLARENQ
jgi:hypothetical protein